MTDTHDSETDLEAEDAADILEQSSPDEERDLQWNENTDDWDSVLEDDDDRDSDVDSEQTTEAVKPDGGSRTQAAVGTRTETGETQPEFVRIDPISDDLLRATVKVFPEHWLTDTEIQKIIQWVVYEFVEGTDPSEPTSARARVAINGAASQMDMNTGMILQLCTTSLYRGRSGMPKAHLHDDLEEVHQRVQATR